MDTYENIAAIIFQQYGLDFGTAERAGGWTNAVWLNGDFALRLSKEQGSDRIRREIERSKMLPASVGYPKNMAVGVTDGYEWSLSERVPGSALSSVWDHLNWTEKAAAVKQIFDRVKGVHAVAVQKVAHFTLSVAWYNAFDKEKSFADMERYIMKKLFTQKQGRILCDILERFYQWRACVTPVLCHGDITIDNLMWHDSKVVSLLDFEHSVIAPCQLDIHSLFNLALIPYDEATARDVVLLTETNCEIQEYAVNVIPLLKPYLTEQSDKDLFLGYNVLYRQRFLEFWLEEPEGDIAQCDAYQKLLSLSDGNHGYLSNIL